MKIYIDDENIVILTLPKSICINLTIKNNKSPEHDIKFIIGRNEFLSEFTIKNKIRQLLFKYGHEGKNSVIY